MSIIEKITTHKNESRELISKEIGRLRHVINNLDKVANKVEISELTALENSLVKLQTMNSNL